MPAHRYVEEISSAAMLATMKSAGVTPTVNLREYVTHTPILSGNKAAHSGFKIQRECPIQEYQWPVQKYFFKSGNNIQIHWLLKKAARGVILIKLHKNKCLLPWECAQNLPFSLHLENI